MALVIWTGTDAQMLKTVIGPVVAQNNVTHRVVPNMTQFPPAGEGDVVLACGSKALALLQGMGLAPKNRTITSLRERPLKHNGAWIFMTFDPSITQREYVRLPEIQWDIQLAIRMHETKSVKPQIGEYRYVESLHELIERIEEKYEATKKPVDVACDLETKSLNPYDSKAWIIAASFTVDEGKSDVLYFERGETPVEPLPWKSEEEMTYWEGLWTQIHWILTTDKVSIRGANFKYDSNWIYQKWKIYCTNHKFDTMLVGSLLDENRCVAPETLILTSDLRWVRADSLQSGDSVVGFDEHGDQGIHRRMRKSLVSSSEVIKKRRLKLNLSNGHSIVVSDNHQFLCKKYPSTHVKVWRKAKNIQPGCVIFSATPHPKDIQGEASDYELGRLSGFLDGEGSVPKLNDFGSWHLGWGQIPHAAHQDMKRVASLIKAEYREHDDNLNLCKSVVFKGAWNSLHALIATRPLRLVAKEPWDNGPLPRGDEAVSVSVLSVEDLGVGPVVALETTTHTFIAEGLLSHNSNSLKLHAKLMTPMGGYEDDMDKYDFSCLEVVPKPEMLNYVGGDTDVTYRVAQVMKRDILKDKKLSNFYVKLLHPASKAFEKLERNGVLIDQAYFQQLKSELGTEIARLQQEMLTCMPHKLRIKYKDDIEQSMADGKSPFKAKILSEFLFSPAGLNLKPQVFTEKTKAPSTSMDHLMMFEGDPVAANFISRFRELGSASKTLSTFVVGFLKHLRQDGRFHATYMLHRGDYGSDDSGTTTGRTSAKDPAVQCLPCWVKVLTSGGLKDILTIVEEYELGLPCKVITHDGSWRDVVGGYRNGVQPLLKITLSSGHTVTCTENHPLLTSMGFVRSDNLRVGDECYVSSDWKAVREVSGVEEIHREGGAECSLPVSVRLRECEGHPCVEPVHGANEIMRVLEGGDQQDPRTHDAHDAEQNLHLLEEHPEEVLLREPQLVQELRGFGGQGLREVAHLRELFGGHGGNAGRSLDREAGCYQGLRAGELQVDSSGPAEQEQAKHGSLDVQREDAGVGRLVGRNRTSSVGADLAEQSRVERGSGTHDAKKAEEAGYLISEITCIEQVPAEETFDLTIEESHSFVANGVVVHNTIPKHSKWAKRLRKAYIAPPGKVILQCDFSQGELRIAAVIAGEPTMIKAYASGADLHAITAAQLNGYSYEDFMLLPEDDRDALRSGGKAGNFGLIYGMQHKGFKEYAYTTYGVSMTEEEAFQKREAFFALYGRLLDWHEEYKGLAHRWGFVRSPLGRVRHLPLINSKDRDIVAQSERQAINSPIQSCLSDMMQLAMVHVDREYGDAVEMFMMTHDSLALYVPEDDAVEWAKRVKSIMENLPLKEDFGWSSPLKFIADAEIGQNMADLKKLKGL